MSRADVKFEPLAIHHGKPVRSTPLPYGHQDIRDEDIEAVIQVLRSDWITTGPKVREFEEAVAAYAGARFAVSFSSGTAALHGAAFASGLGPGDQAITTPFTFCATANCALYVGATPVFADVCSSTLNIDPEQIKRKVTPHTKAILPVDYAGHPAELDAIQELADKHGLVVIEDAAHALGSTYRGQRVGSLSRMTVFSFHPVKHITTGEGGMVTTDDPESDRRLRRFRSHGVDEEQRRKQGATKGQWHYEMIDLGYNYRLTDIGSALGLSQLKRLPENISRRRDIVGWYNGAFAEMPGLIIPVEEPHVRSAWHLYPIRLELDRFTVGRQEIFEALRAENILVNVHYIPVHLHPYYRQRFGYEGGEFPVAEAAYQSLITLPLFHSMTKHDAEDVISAVRKVTGHFLRR